jgi:DNA-binding Lrp family transcriptional regulator
MDKKDKKIIEQLKQNSRASVRDIASATNLRPSTVHSRMKKLTEQNVIEKFTVKLSNEAMEEDFIVFIFIRTNEKIKPEVFKNKSVKEAFGITGEYDVYLKCKFKDIKDFNEFILDLRNTHNLRKTLTMISTTVIKEDI